MSGYMRNTCVHVLYASVDFLHKHGSNSVPQHYLTLTTIKPGDPTFITITCRSYSTLKLTIAMQLQLSTLLTYYPAHGIVLEPVWWQLLCEGMVPDPEHISG